MFQNRYDHQLFDSQSIIFNITLSNKLATFENIRAENITMTIQNPLQRKCTFDWKLTFEQRYSNLNKTNFEPRSVENFFLFFIRKQTMDIKRNMDYHEKFKIDISLVRANKKIPLCSSGNPNI